MGLTFQALILLPLADATAINFTAPIFATILSFLILREFVGVHRWAAVLVGLHRRADRGASRAARAFRSLASASPWSVPSGRRA